MAYKFLEHTADVKFQATGKNLEQAFEFSAIALQEAICGKLKINKKLKKKIEFEGKDLENLLYNFLEEFLYLLDAENFLFCKIRNLKIDKKNFKLSAEVFGDRASKYDFSNSVKAITYNDMKIKKQKNRWVVEGVFDV